MGTIPAKQYLKITERFPDYMSAVESLGKTAKKEGPIDEKTAPPGSNSGGGRDSI